MKLEYVIIIYIVGFLTSYILIKKFVRVDNDKNEWINVLLTFMFSLFSWFTVIMIGLTEYKKIFKILGIKTFKPPKWL